MLKLKVKMDLDRKLTDDEALKKAHLEKGGLVQQSIDKSVIDWDLQVRTMGYRHFSEKSV